MNTFLRKMYISAVVSACILFAAVSVCTAYEKMRLIGFGEYRRAVEITEQGVKIFDFEIKIK